MPDDEDDDDITPHHHGDNHSQQHQNGGDSSHQHHHDNSPTHQSNLNEPTRCPPTHTSTSHSESEEEQREGGGGERGQGRDEPEQEDRDEGGFDLDSLLMREEDIVREKEQQSRKRAREGASEEARGPADTNSSEKDQDTQRQDGRKRLKHSWDDDLDELLSEEDDLLSEMATYNFTTS